MGALLHAASTARGRADRLGAAIARWVTAVAALPPLSAGPLSRLDLVEATASSAACGLKAILQVHPKLGGGSEKDTEPQRRVGGDAGRLLRDALDAGAGDAELARQRVGRQAERLQKFLAQHLTRMQRGQLDHVRLPQCQVVAADRRKPL